MPYGEKNCETCFRNSMTFHVCISCGNMRCDSCIDQNAKGYCPDCIQKCPVCGNVLNDELLARHRKIVTPDGKIIEKHFCPKEWSVDGLDCEKEYEESFSRESEWNSAFGYKWAEIKLY